MPDQANNQQSDNQKAKPGFFTPARIVLTCAFAGVMIAVWLTSCNSGDQNNQTSAPTAPAATPAAPNTRIVTSPNTGEPTLVTLSQDIRDTKVKTLDGGSVKLSDYNNKVLVVNLWATWCGPCRQEMPDLVKLSKEYKSRGLVVLGVATTYNERDDQAHVKDFIKSQNIDYKILWDDGSLAGPLVQSVNGRSVIPQSFVISRDGKIMKHFSGFSAMSTPALMRQAVEEALADKGKA